MPRAVVWLLCLLLSHVVSAADVEPKYKKVIGQMEQEGPPLAMSARYGAWLTYEIGLELVTAIFTVKGFDAPLDINWEDEIKEALEEWKTGAMRSHISSDPVAFGDPPGLTFDIDTRFVHGLVSYGSTVIRSTPTTIKIGLKSIGDTAQDGYQKMMEKGVLAPAVTLEDYVRMLVRLTLKHEIGHALGLEHTNSEPGTMNTALYEIVEIMPEGASMGVPISTVAPSIMIPGAENYFELLSRHLGRSISIQDLQLSANDIDGAYFMWSGTTYSRARAFVARTVSTCLGVRNCR